MKYKLFYSVLVCIFVNMSLFAQVLPPNDKNYNLVFKDDFDSLGLNASDWSRVDWHRWTWKFKLSGNCYHFNDLRTLLPQNLSYDTSQTGFIRLIAKRENPPIYEWVNNYCDSTLVYHGYDYSSPAWLASKNKYKYGYFEARCRIPYIDTLNNTIRGIGPNFWLWTGSPTWSELDCFEYIPKVNQDSGFVYESPHFLSTSHFESYDSINSISHWSSSGYKYLNNTGNFHTYSVWWTPHKVEYYFENQLMHTTTLYQDIMNAQSLIFDINIFTSPDFEPDSNSYFPFNYDVDYVKVYQLKQNCAVDTSFCSFNSSSFNFALYRSMCFGDGNCNIIMQSTSPLRFLSIDSFTLQPNSEISADTEALFEFESCQSGCGIYRSNPFNIQSLKEREVLKFH